MDDFPKIYSFSFFATTFAQIKQRSVSTTFFGVAIKSQIAVKTTNKFALINIPESDLMSIKFAGKSFCCNLIGSILNNDCDMIGQSSVPTNKGKGMWFERKQPFVGRRVA